MSEEPDNSALFGPDEDESDSFWPDRKTCSRCGGDAFATLQPESSPHYALARCSKCGHNWWLPKPTTPESRGARAKNRAIIDDWRETLGGELVCFHCGVRESDYRAGFDAHHGVDVSEVEEQLLRDERLVFPYCHDCHKSAERLRLYRQHLQVGT